MPQPRRPLPPPADPQENLEWEHKNRWWAIVGALVGAVLPLAGLFLAPKPKANEVPELTSALIYFNAHATGFVLSQVVISLGTIGTGALLVYLYHATKGRRPQLQGAARVLAIAGPILLTIGGIAGQVYLAQKSADFVKGPKTDPEANKILTGGVRVATGSAGIAGQFALGFAFVMISLNAMRAGLLTRFMGILGILVGVFPVLLSLLASTLSGTASGPAPIVQFFWLGAIAYLISGRWPNGLPKAWSTGKEEPWPSSQEMKEQRQAGLDRRRGGQSGNGSGGGGGGGGGQQRPTGLLGMLMGGGGQRGGGAQATEAKAEPEAAEGTGEGPTPRTKPSPATSAKKKKKRKRRS
jgi:hypothetical protein